MSACGFSHAPCHCKEYTLEVLASDLALGTARLKLLKNGEPFAKRTVGVSYIFIEPSPSVVIVPSCKSKSYTTDADGEFDVKFKKGKDNEVRLSVNLQIGTASASGCIRLTAVLTPRVLLGASPLKFLSTGERVGCNKLDLSELQEFVFISRLNQFASDTSGKDHSLTPPQQGGPCLSSRALAINQIAVADAYNSINQKFAFYCSNMPVFRGGNALAAMAQAAHDTLLALFSQQAVAIDAALNNWLSVIPDGSAKDIGIQAGKKAAELILAKRTGDGSAGTNGTAPATNTTTDPGKWSAAPADSNAALLTAVGKTYGASKPWVVANTAELIQKFRAPEPPLTTSTRYLAAFNNQISIGGAGGKGGNPLSPYFSVRTQDQYEYGVFWGYDGVRELCAPPNLYFAVSRQILTEHRKSALALLHALSLVAVSMAEAGVAAWDSKYFYSHWRPITALRYTGSGVHPAAIPQPDWLCLGAPASNVSNGGKNFTPPFPAYVSGHAVFGSAMFAVLRREFGTDDVPFSFCSKELDGKTSANDGEARPFKPRSYLRLSQAEEENGDSRLVLGIHWDYDRDEGIIMGEKIAAETVDRVFNF